MAAMRRWEPEGQLQRGSPRAAAHMPSNLRTGGAPWLVSSGRRSARGSWASGTAAARTSHRPSAKSCSRCSASLRCVAGVLFSPFRARWQELGGHARPLGVLDAPGSCACGLAMGVPRTYSSLYTEHAPGLLPEHLLNDAQQSTPQTTVSTTHLRHSFIRARPRRRHGRARARARLASARWRHLASAPVMHQNTISVCTIEHERSA